MTSLTLLIYTPSGSSVSALCQNGYIVKCHHDQINLCRFPRQNFAVELLVIRHTFLVQYWVKSLGRTGPC